MGWKLAIKLQWRLCTLLVLSAVVFAVKLLWRERRGLAVSRLVAVSPPPAVMIPQLRH